MNTSLKGRERGSCSASACACKKKGAQPPLGFDACSQSWRSRRRRRLFHSLWSICTLKVCRSGEAFGWWGALFFIFLKIGYVYDFSEHGCISQISPRPRLEWLEGLEWVEGVEGLKGLEGLV